MKGPGLGAGGSPLGGTEEPRFYLAAHPDDLRAQPPVFVPDSASIAEIQADGWEAEVRRLAEHEPPRELFVKPKTGAMAILGSMILAVAAIIAAAVILSGCAGLQLGGAGNTQAGVVQGGQKAGGEGATATTDFDATLPPLPDIPFPLQVSLDGKPIAVVPVSPESRLEFATKMLLGAAPRPPEADPVVAEPEEIRGAKIKAPPKVEAPPVRMCWVNPPPATKYHTRGSCIRRSDGGQNVEWNAEKMPCDEAIRRGRLSCITCGKGE